MHFTPFQAKVDLFKALSDAQLAHLSECVQLKSYQKDEIIFLEHESARDLYIVYEGCAKLFKLSVEGKSQTLLSDLLGITRENLSRTLNDFAKNNGLLFLISKLSY